MRVIKFRAWDGTRLRSWEDIVETIGLHHWILEQPEHIILMQYTGLQDKNGVEIFEGDILGHKEPEIEVLCEVEYDSDTGGWIGQIRDAFRKIIGHFEFTSNHPTYYTRLNVTQTEIIGNIYKNPELLK